MTRIALFLAAAFLLVACGEPTKGKTVVIHGSPGTTDLEGATDVVWKAPEVCGVKVDFVFHRDGEQWVANGLTITNTNDTTVLVDVDNIDSKVVVIDACVAGVNGIIDSNTVTQSAVFANGDHMELSVQQGQGDLWQHSCLDLHVGSYLDDFVDCDTQKFAIDITGDAKEDGDADTIEDETSP